jgi:long-subunit fatty acid transport protein
VYLGATSDSLISYSNNVTTYSIGVGRKFSEEFSGSVVVGYEAAQGALATNLAPTDGLYSVQVGVKYSIGMANISGGIRYVMLGDATTETILGDFTGNSAIGVGMQIGFGF